MWQTIETAIHTEPTKSITIILGSILLAFFVGTVGTRILLFLAKKTATRLDDQLIHFLKAPLFISVLLFGLAWLSDLHLHGQLHHWAYASIKTIATIFWSTAAIRTGVLLVGSLASRPKTHLIIQQRTAPIFVMFLRITIIAMAFYYSFLFWHIDVTAWIASAGILGIAIGFGAQDTLANLFAGIFILADAPYTLGDYIWVDENLSGTVTQIGMRSTRIVTLDNKEINIPNSVMSTSKIINEVGGPSVNQRIHASVGVSYDSDVEEVRSLLLACAIGVDGVCEQPKPEALFVEIGASSINFDLRVWITDPLQKALVLDALNTRIFQSLNEAGVEIPFNKLDLQVRELPHSSPPA